MLMAEKNTFLCMKAAVKEKQVASSSGVVFFFLGGGVWLANAYKPLSHVIIRGTHAGQDA